MDLRRVAVVFAVAALSLIGGDSPRGTPAPDAHRPDRISVLHPADGLGAVVAGFGDVWVDDRARERLLRVDARSGRVLAAIPVDGRERVAWRRGLGFRAGATLGRDALVWVHSAAIHERGDRVTGLRLATGGLVTTAILPAFGATGVAAAAGHVAIATAGGRLIVLRRERPGLSAATMRQRPAAFTQVVTLSATSEVQRPRVAGGGVEVDRRVVPAQVTAELVDP